MLSLLKNVKHLRHISKLKGIMEQRKNKKGVILGILLELALELGISLFFSLGFINILVILFCSLLGSGAFYYSYKNNKILKKNNNKIVSGSKKEIINNESGRDYSTINLMEIIESNRKKK